MRKMTRARRAAKYELNIVLGCKPWNRKTFNETICHFPGRWKYIQAPEGLSLKDLAALRPRRLFFLHWSWLVPANILSSYECIAFHMTDLPFGRGGSPLQNLIVRGIRRTRLSAFRMTPRFDEGPIYLMEELSLDGSAQEIYVRASELAARMIRRILRENPRPRPQQGKPVIFRRRTPVESQIPASLSLEQMHDFIRMLDADTYPRAYLEYSGHRFEFRRSVLYPDRVEALVTITVGRRG